MPDLSAYLTALRAGGYSFSGYLSVVPKRVIFSRAVNMATITEPLLAITFDDPYGGVGAYTDVPEDAECVLYDQNTQTVKGRFRVAYGGASATVLQVNETSEGRVDVANNDRFEVWDEYRLRDTLVGATDQFPKDSRRAYVNEGDEPAPRIIVGGAAAGKVDATTGLLTVSFDATRSRPTDPDNADGLDSSNGLDFLYAIGDGTLVMGALTDALIQVTFPANVTYHRHVTLTVTDRYNGAASVRKIPVFSYDFVNTTPVPVKGYTATLDRANGSSATFELASGCDLDTLREGALIVYWEREWRNGSEQSVGNQVADRSNVKFVGYLRRETLTMDPSTDTLSLEVISPLLKLAELGGFTQALKTVASPVTWQQDEAVTIHKLAWYVWRYHSTAAVSYDLHITGEDYNYPEFFVQQANLRAQMEEVCAGISATFTCDRTGRFLIARNLQRGTSAERSAAVTSLALTARDLSEIPSLVYEHSYQYAQLVGKAFTENGAPLLSVAPGEAPAEAPDLSTLERLIVTGDAGYDQLELNAITSDAWAEMNSLYDGLNVPKGVTLKPNSSYDVLDPAYPDWLTLTLATTTNRRGRGFTGNRFILQKVELEADAETGLKAITWTVDHETLGQGATTRAVPDEATLPPYTPPGNVPMPTPTRSVLLGSGLANLALPNADNYMYLLNLASHAHDRYSLTALGMSGDLIGFAVDPFSPLYRGTGTAVNGMLVTTTHAYYMTDIDGTPVLSNAYAFGFTTTYNRRNVQSTRIQSGFWGVISHLVDSNQHVDVTLDNGATWTRYTGLFGTYSGGGGDNAYAAIQLSEHVPNRIWVASVAPGTTTLSQLYRSDDAGASWSAFGASYTGDAEIVHIPVQETAESYVIAGVTGNQPAVATLRYPLKISASGATQFAPVEAAVYYGSDALFGIKTYDLNASIVLFMGYSGQNGKSGVWKSLDGGATWINLIAPAARGSDAAHRLLSGNIAGNNANYLWVWGSGGSFMRSVDQGATFEDYSAEFVATYPSIGVFLNIAGVG